MPEKDQLTAPTSSGSKDTKAASSDGDSSTPTRTDQATGDRRQAIGGTTPDPTQDAPSAERRAPSSKDKEPACPTCGGKLERYVGENLHKLRTAFCHAEGKRVPLEQDSAASTDG